MASFWSLKIFFGNFFSAESPKFTLTYVHPERFSRNRKKTADIVIFKRNKKTEKK